MFSAARIIELVQERRSAVSDPLQVYWCKVEVDSRSQFADELRTMGSGFGIVPIVLRRQIFLDPNAVLSDLNHLVCDNRTCFDGLSGEASQQIVIVVIARSDFRLSQTGSPVQLPDWFPVMGGKEVYVRVRDLLFEVEGVSFNAPEARGEDMAAQLWDVEDAIARRLVEVHPQNPGRSIAFWTGIGKVLDKSLREADIDDLVAAYAVHTKSVGDHRAYRPSAKSKTSVLSHLITLVQRSSPDQMPTLSKNLATALDLGPDIETRQTMVAVMLRPTQLMDSPTKFAHSLLTTAYGSYQFLNAMAHASEYPQVSVGFLYLTSKDIRVGLQVASRTLNESPAGR